MGALAGEGMEIVECDVAIIGGGPAGCTCALYTSRSDLSTVVLDKNPGSGALAITSHIANYPGVDRSMSGSELLDRMRDQAVQYGTRYERAQVFLIDVTEDETGDSRYTKTVYTPDITVRARCLVLATGAMGRVGRPFPGEAEYLGRGVSYCATCDGAFYRDSPVAVYGASTESIEEALYLTKFASVLYWITSVDISMDTESGVERNKVLDQGLLTKLLECANVVHMERTKLIEVIGDVGGVTGVKVKRPDNDECETLAVEGAFVYGAGGGSKPITDFVQNKVDLDENGGVIVDGDMKTSVNGVYAIGDIRNTDYKQVVVAASDGCIAAMSIEKFLNNRKTVKVDWIHR
jgi:thioredoxin reductase (NADPH)